MVHEGVAVPTAPYGTEMLFSFKNEYQYTYLNTYLALYFRTPKLSEKHTQPMETSFHPPLTLVLLLATYPHSH